MLSRFMAIVLFSTLAAATSVAAAATVPVEMGTLTGVQDLGRASASTRVHIALVLNYHRAAELGRLVDAQADPRSSVYHHFLTPAEFRSYFSPSPAEYGKVIAALQRAGFTITHTSPNDTVIDASAPAPVAARYFETEIHRVLSPAVGATYTNTRSGVVPPEIAGVTLGVFGLDNVAVLHAGPIPWPAGVPRPARRNVRRSGYPLFGPDGGYGPQMFVASYDLPAANGTTGTGRFAGVVMDGDLLDTDLTAFLSYFGVLRTGPATVRHPVDGGAPPFPHGDAFETTLDVQTIVSLAPGVAMNVYEIPSLTYASDVDGYNAVVSDDLVDTVNSSFGGCELLDKKFERALDALETQGSAEGMTFHSSTGDNGVYAYGCKVISVGAPADTPHNVAVGGTTLAVDPDTGEETSEVGWGGPGSTATGGGVSGVFRAPAYQRGVPNLIPRGRNIPDVAFDANSLTGASIYFNGSFQGPDGGTSLSSPIFGAALTELNQLQNSRSGNFNVTLYKTWLADGYGTGSTAYFRDITEGSIAPYYAQPGYDQMTGIGAMQADNFAGLLLR